MKKNYKVTIKNKVTGKVYQENVSSEEYILKGNFKCSDIQIPGAAIAGKIMHATIAALKNDFKNPYGNVEPSVGETALMEAGWNNDRDLGYTSIWTMSRKYCGSHAGACMEVRTCTETPCKNYNKPPRVLAGPTTEICQVTIEY